ncbi:MAG: type I methionyl aminopeptidase [Defluviitaleaceae bacterium]|nr:type I methionyl aminopeptidase [Defluviitaleaceae bacterium]
MAIIIKNSEQINKMRIASEIVAKTLELLEKSIKVGITTNELDIIAAEYIKSRGAVSSFLGFEAPAIDVPIYPKHTCISVNDEVIHGIPSLRKLKNGDIVSIDVGAYIGGFHGDAARTFLVGDVDEEHKKLVSVTEKSFFEGMKFAKTSEHLHSISAAIGDYIESFGYSILESDFGGHGIGKTLHEDPAIPNCRMKNRGPKLHKGMTLAIEPMVNQGSSAYKILKDGWTVVTKDGKYSAHYENTILITDGEPEILTIY